MHFIAIVIQTLFWPDYAAFWYILLDFRCVDDKEPPESTLWLICIRKCTSCIFYPVWLECVLPSLWNYYLPNSLLCPKLFDFEIIIWLGNYYVPNSLLCLKLFDLMLTFYAWVCWLHNYLLIRCQDKVDSYGI